MSRLAAVVVSSFGLSLLGCGYWFDVLEEVSSPSGGSTVRVLLGRRPILPFQKGVVRVEIENPHSGRTVILSDRFKGSKSDPGLYCNAEAAEVNWSPTEDVVSVLVRCFAAADIQLGYRLSTDRVVAGGQLEAATGGLPQ